MAEAGTFADRVKQQADIVRVIGEYVRLKKSGQNFTGLCPFHQEKTPSFAVHPVKQIYHCFGCGVGGDVFKFVQEMEKCTFPEAVRSVAEKCGIAVPRPRERSPEERRETQVRSVLVELHREAAAFFARQLTESNEGRVARAYLEERGLDAAVLERFSLGYAPSAGDALLRHLKPKFAEKLLDASGLFSRDASGRLFDRFRRRIMFPIANESGKVVAFGGRAMGDDQPKYLNSPETPIYSKSNILYHLDRAKEAIRKQDFAILVEGYMDTIAVFGSGAGNVVASCGTSLAEPQVKLLARHSRNVVVNFDPDLAGQAATERSLGLLLEHGFQVRVLALPSAAGQKADPDLFIRTEGADAYAEQVQQSPAYLDYLIGRARARLAAERSHGQGKLVAVNYLMPYVQRIPDRILRSEWASRIAAELGVDEPVLRESLRRAAAERRGEVKPPAELLAPAVKPAERRLVRILAEADALRNSIAAAIRAEDLHRGLETEKILAALVAAASADEPIDPARLAEVLDDKDRRLFFEIVFESAAEPDAAEAESCLAALRQRKTKAELDAVQRQIEAHPDAEEMRRLLARKQKLRQQMAQAAGAGR